MAKIPTTPRRTQAERTLLTQQKLVDGTIELLKKKGYAAFRTAEVADVAGVSRGAQTHHFPSKDGLVLQALEEVFSRTQKRALERIEASHHAPKKLLALLAADSEEFFLGSDFLLSLDLMMVDPESLLGQEVKRLAQKYRPPVEQAWVASMVKAGYSRQQAEEVVLLTFAVARGLGIRQTIEGPNDSIDRVMKAWQLIAEGILKTPVKPTQKASPEKLPPK